MKANFIVTEKIDINESNKQIKYNDYSRAEIISHKLSETNCYDYVAGIQKIIDIKQIKISKEKVNRVIKELLICPVCREIYTDIVQLKSCLHSYCKKCFDNCVRTSNKKCVCCRNPFETRRAAFSNTTINELISLFIPDKEKYKNSEEEEFQMNKDKYIFNGTIAKNELIESYASSSIDDTNNNNNNNNIDNDSNVKEKNNSLANISHLNNEPSIDYLGHKRPLLQDNGDNNDDNNNIDAINARFGLSNQIENIPNAKRPKYDITKSQTPLIQVVNEFHNGDYAIIQIIPYNHSNEPHPFKTVKLVLHQRTSLHEISIYISHRLNYTVLPNNLYFIIKEKDTNRTLTNFQMTIKSIIEFYIQTSSFVLYFNNNE